MPTDTERRLEALENLLLFGGGVAAGTASGRQLAAAAARQVPGTALGIARRHPTAAILALGYTAHRLGLGPIETAELIAEEMSEPAMLTPRLGDVKKIKRKVSKANKAVQHAVSLLKAGTKRSTGADKGKLSKGYWKVATRAAGLANPKTKSSIGKGKSITKALARKLKKWWK
jgi:hypothetical protein